MILCVCRRAAVADMEKQLRNIRGYGTRDWAKSAAFTLSVAKANLWLFKPAEVWHAWAPFLALLLSCLRADQVGDGRGSERVTVQLAVPVCVPVCVCLKRESLEGHPSFAPPFPSAAANLRRILAQYPMDAVDTKVGTHLFARAHMSHALCSRVFSMRASPTLSARGRGLLNIRQCTRMCACVVPDQEMRVKWHSASYYHDHVLWIIARILLAVIALTAARKLDGNARFGLYCLSLECARIASECMSDEVCMWTCRSNIWHLDECADTSAAHCLTAACRGVGQHNNRPER